MKNKIMEFINVNRLIEKEDKVLVAFSGGPDSVCLLHLLNSLKEELKIQLGAAHINHLIRGEEADKDESYVKEFCEGFNIPLYILRKDVEGYAKENGISTETAGRKIRYDFFDKISKENGYTKIATAHNANDQVETILMRVMRGTGIEGLCGIPVKRDGTFIRPILGLERGEIEKYCEDNNLNARIDKSNLEREYSRNKIRLDMIPYMKENFNPNLTSSVNRMIFLLNKDNDYIQQECDKIFQECVVNQGDKVIVKKKIKEYHFSILSRVIRKALGQVSNDAGDIELKHINDIISLFDFPTNKQIHLPNKLYVKNIYGDIQVGVKSHEKNVNYEISIDKNSLKNRYEFEKSSIIFDIIEKDKNYKFNNSNFIKHFDYDEINGNIIIRKRKDGDKIQPLGMKGNKKLKDIFINEKIPVEKRDSIAIVQFGEEIAWVVGVRTSEKFKVTRETKKMLRITFQGKEI